MRSMTESRQPHQSELPDTCFAPHCDGKVLHAPGECWACDLYPVWQRARETWGINFTGKNEVGKLPCPSETQRELEDINAWPGNRPHKEGEPSGYFS